MDTSLFHPRNINLPYGVDIAGNLAATQGNQAIAGLKGLGDIATGTGGIEDRLSHAADLIDKYQADNEPELTPEGIEQLRSIAPGFMAAKNYLSHTPAGIAAHLIGKGYGKAFDIAGEAAGRVDPRLAGGVGVTREVLPWMIPGAGEAKEAEAVAEEAGPTVKKAMQMSLSKATDPHIGHPEMGIIGYHPDALVLDAEHPDTGQHMGRLILEPSADGKSLQAKRMDVFNPFNPGDRAKGVGPAMLERAVGYAHDNGMDFTSDNKISPSMYSTILKLHERGFPAEFNASSAVTDDQYMTSPDGSAVFRVPKPVPADDAVMGETPNPGAAAGGPSSYAEGGGVIEDFAKLIAKNMKEPKPLNGAPTHIEGFGPVAPNPFIRALADQYKQDHGITTPSHPDFVRVDPAQAKRVADAYDAMQHNPSDPKVAAAYQAMIDETAKQYQYIKATGFKPEFIPEGAPDPYAANPRLAVKDINENNHMWVFPTSSGFGTLDPALADHPLLAHSGEYFGDQPATNNDLFRVVHDYFGHAKEGNGFRANGEENAWVQHAGMYSDLARPAMTAETRGQNSWVNSGPFADQNKGASGAKTVYANQKAGLLPDEFNVSPKVLDDQLGDNVVQAFMPKEKPPADIGEFPWNAANADTMKTPWSKRLKPIDMGGDPPTFAGGGGVFEDMANLISRYGAEDAPQGIMYQAEHLPAPVAAPIAPLDASQLADKYVPPTPVAGEGPMPPPGAPKTPTELMEEYLADNKGYAKNYRVTYPAVSRPMGEYEQGFNSPTPRTEWTPNQQTVKDPVRLHTPGIYKPVSEVVDEAAALAAKNPEDPDMERLFGPQATRKNLAAVGRGRQGNLLGQSPDMTANPKGAAAAQAIMTPENDQRLVDALTYAMTKPELADGMLGWYVMDPAYDRVHQIVRDPERMAYLGVNPETIARAKADPQAEGDRLWDQLNTAQAISSPQTPVDRELEVAGTAHWLREAGRWQEFEQMADAAKHGQNPQDLQDLMTHVYHNSQNVPAMNRYFERGKIGSVPMDAPKAYNYGEASNVPAIGHQTRTPVGDTHFAGAVGLLDTRTAADPKGSLSTSELQTYGPHFESKVANRVGLESVPAQALLWGTYAPQTGVRSGIGMPKLELMTQEIKNVAQRYGISSLEDARDHFLMGTRPALSPSQFLKPDEVGDLRMNPETASGDEVVQHVMRTHYPEEKTLATKDPKQQERDVRELLGPDANGPYKKVDYPLDRIHNDTPISSDVIKRYAERDTPYPAIVMDKNGGVRDGNHRIEAARMRGDETIPAYVPLTLAVSP